MAGSRHTLYTGETRITFEIDLSVKVASLSVFAFSHRSQETWRAGRLVSLSSETVEQGETLHVAGAAMPQGFRDEQGQCRYRIPCHLDVKQLVDPSDAGAGDGGYRRI